MSAVKVSPKYQVVIPLEVRESLDIRPGEKVQVLQYDNRIELIPVPIGACLAGEDGDDHWVLAHNGDCDPDRCFGGLTVSVSRVCDLASHSAGFAKRGDASRRDDRRAPHSGGGDCASNPRLYHRPFRLCSACPLHPQPLQTLDSEEI